MSVVFRIQGLNYYLPSQSQRIRSNINYPNKLSFKPRVSNQLTDDFSHSLIDSKSYPSYRPPRFSPTQIDQQLTSYPTKPVSPTLNNNDASFIYGNSILKSNKAELLNIFEEKLFNGENANKYINKHGVVITEDGPFWPDDYRILYPTPKFLRRELTPKEFYLSPSMSNTINQPTYDNQPATLKYTDRLKHSLVIYDMEKSTRLQQIKSNDSEQSCPQLIFESRFEGGNLRQVKRVGQFEYELILRPDLYTRRHTQWYFFRVQNMIANVTYRFRIINLMKRSSLYNDGMQILLFSDLDAKRDNRGWHRVGHHIRYAENKNRAYNSLLERDINYFELDFQLEFPHSGDTCYIAHCYPYTFTDLKDDLEYLSTTRPRDVFRREVLCESQAGNSCFLITVTDESVPIHKKKFVFITARIHPGETNSSYMMRGLLEFITSDNFIAQKLRSQLVFKIIPMLNPDGVIVGNYRCSLTGKDMNRNFRHPRKHNFPIIYHIKELITSLQKQQREILAFCDLHGHSRKSNVFAYGCDGCDGPQPDMKSFLNARILPFLMSQTAPEMFSFDSCKFHVHRCKESTGRVVMWKEMLIKNSFTLEASFAGSSLLDRPCHFNIQDYEKFGQCICQSLRQYLDILADSSRLDSIYLDITRNVLQRLDPLKIPADLLSLIFPSKQSSTSMNTISNCIDILTQCQQTIVDQNESSSSDSDSDPEGGEMPDVCYRKNDSNSKKKSRKKPAEKIAEERAQKTIRKQQIERATRTLPERGTLFTSKYANRNGHGLPIFTTERALERRHQKRLESSLQDTQVDRQTADEDETDNELFPKTYRSQVENSTLVDQIQSNKRTPSLISLPHQEIPPTSLEPSVVGTYFSPTPVFKNLTQRRFHRLPRRDPHPKLDTEQTNISPPIISLTNIVDLTRHCNRSPTNQENDISIIESLNEPVPIRSLPKRDTPILRSKISFASSNNIKQILVQRTANQLPKQSLTPIESPSKDRSLIANQENSIQRVHQIIKRQIFLPFNKK